MSIVKIVVIVHIQFWGKRRVELNLFLSFWHFELLLIKLLNLYRRVSLRWERETFARILDDKAFGQRLGALFPRGRQEICKPHKMTAVSVS